MTLNDYRVQSVAFDKSLYTPEQVHEWVRSHGYKYSKIDETDTQLRARQVSPEYLKRLGFTQYVTKNIGHGIQLILVYSLLV
jgi:bisphosphoglycerate-dependent phosphoglycerate mutase